MRINYARLQIINLAKEIRGNLSVIESTHYYYEFRISNNLNVYNCLKRQISVTERFNVM